MTLSCNECYEELKNPHYRLKPARRYDWVAICKGEFEKIPQNELYSTWDDAARGRTSKTELNPEGMEWGGIVRIVNAIADTNYTPWEKDNSLSGNRPPLSEKTVGFILFERLKLYLPKSTDSLSEYFS